MDEVINKLIFEMVQLTGHFEDSEVYRTYIQRAIVIGSEHFSRFKDEIIAMDQQGHEVGRFKDVSEAHRKLGIWRQSISKCLKGTRHTAGGLIFVHHKDWKS